MPHLMPIQFIPGIEINESQLTHFFNLESSQGILYRKEGWSATFLPLMLMDKSLLFIIKQGKVEHFASNSYDFNALQILFDTIPNELQPLKAQLNTLLIAINSSISCSETAEENELRKVNKYLQQMVENGSTEIFRRGDNISLRTEASEQEVKGAYSVAEHSFIVKDIKTCETVCLGTTGIASCLALVIYNPISKKIALAHLDMNTIDTYYESLTSMFNQCQGSVLHKNEVYILGQEHMYSAPISTKMFGLAGAYNASRLLALSLYDFLDQRKDCDLKGTLYSNAIEPAGTVLVTVVENKLQIFTANTTLSYLLGSNFRSQIIGAPINYQQLIDINLSASLNQTNIMRQEHLKESMKELKRTDDDNTVPMDSPRL